LKFYIEELQKVLHHEFPYDTYLEEKERELLVEKLNSNKETTWVYKNNFQNA
jgi:hypothetical protein